MKFLTAVLVLLAALPSCASTINYSAESIEAWVVDADTGAPVEGAVVVAHWQLMGGMEGGNIVGQVMVLETVTDAKGRFHFPAWGPVAHRGPGRLDIDDPQIIIFKSGYKFLALANEMTKEAIEFRLPPQRKSRWNGKTIRLKKHGEDLTAAVEDFGNLSSHTLHFVLRDPDTCMWKQVPRMLIALQDQRRAYEKRGVPTNLPGVGSGIDQRLSRADEFFAGKGEPKCGSPRDFIEGFRQ